MKIGECLRKGFLEQGKKRTLLLRKYMEAEINM